MGTMTSGGGPEAAPNGAEQREEPSPRLDGRVDGGGGGGGDDGALDCMMLAMGGGDGGGCCMGFSPPPVTEEVPELSTTVSAHG